MAYTPHPDAGLPQWCISIAHSLGWSEPGLVLMWTTVIVLVAFPFLVVGFIHVLLHIASESKYEADNTDSALAEIWYRLLVVIALLIVFVIEFVLSIMLIWVGYSMLKQFRDWWHKEM